MNLGGVKEPSNRAICTARPVSHLSLLCREKMKKGPFSQLTWSLGTRACESACVSVCACVPRTSCACLVDT